MTATLILLYALNAASTVPVGCFIAALVLLGVEILAKITVKVLVHHKE